VHLALAARSGWTLITHNASDFLLLHAAWQLWEWGVEKGHGGILILFAPAPPPLPRQRRRAPAAARRFCACPIDAGGRPRATELVLRYQKW
jgi:hypothetical protein